jgi:hypothetical protein
MPVPPDAYLPGYAAYLLVVFLPGVGLGELFDLWPEGSTLTERLAYSFGLGLAVDTLVLLVRTSGLSVGGVALKGIDLATVYLLIGIGLVSLAASVGWRRKLRIAAKPKGVDWALLLVMLVLGAVESVHFLKYPIFPQYQSVDFGAHVQFVQSLISGAQTSIPAGILYFGVHFQLASALLLVGGEPLVTVQRTMALLVFLSPLLFYLAAKSLFSRRLAGVVVAGVYAFSGTIWFAGVFDSGLFPNFFGILAALFLIVATLNVSASLGSVKGWSVFLLALVMAYFSHFTTVTLLPALLLLPLIQLLKGRKMVVGYLAPAVAAVAPGVLGLAVFPSFLAKALELAVAGGGNLTGTTALSAALSGLPVLGFMALEVFDDVGFAFLLVFAAICVYKGVKGKRVLVAVPVVWLLSLFVAAPANVSAWRFSYEAIVPLTLMAGYGIFCLLPKPRAGSRRRPRGSYLSTLVVLAILLTPIVATSWAQTSVADAATDTGASSDAQQAVYSAIYWLQANTPGTSAYLSATDWRFSFTSLMISRTTFGPPSGECLTDPQAARRSALQDNASYIIVTLFVTCSLPPDPQLFLWNTLMPSSNLTLVYSNPDVKVFQVVR